MGGGDSKETTCCPRVAGRHGGAPAPSAAEPVRVVISGAAGQIGYSLLPMIAKGDMFGPTQRVHLQCLDLNLPAVKENMKGVQMELEDGAFPLLHRAEFHTDDKAAFDGADYAILLGAFPKAKGTSQQETLEKNVMIFRTMGHAIEHYAHKDCKVLVAGNPASTNALICANFAPKIPKEHFFSLTRLDQNRAACQIAKRANVSVHDVRNVIIWGSNGRSQFPDVEHCTVKGKPAAEVLASTQDQKWLEADFLETVKSRGQNILDARKASCALSAARAITEHVRDLHCGTRPGEFSSMGVWSTGNEYNIADDLMFSMPIICQGKGRCSLAPGLTISNSSRMKMKQIETELITERSNVQQIFRKNAQSTPTGAAGATAAA